MAADRGAAARAVAVAPARASDSPLGASTGVYGHRRASADADEESRVHQNIRLVPGQLGWHPFRPLGNLQRRVLSLPRPRKRSAACFGAFRGLGNVQRRVLMLSEASEMFSGVFWSFPTRRKRSAARFDVFRGLGRGANMRRRAFPAHPAYLCRRLSGIWMRCERSDTMSDYYLLLRDYSNYYL